MGTPLLKGCNTFLWLLSGQISCLFLVGAWITLSHLPYYIVLSMYTCVCVIIWQRPDKLQKHNKAYWCSTNCQQVNPVAVQSWMLRLILHAVNSGGVRAPLPQTGVIWLTCCSIWEGCIHCMGEIHLKRGRAREGLKFTLCPADDILYPLWLLVGQ